MIKVLYENVFTGQGVSLEMEVLLIKCEERGGDGGGGRRSENRGSQELIGQPNLEGKFSVQ